MKQLLVLISLFIGLSVQAQLLAPQQAHEEVDKICEQGCVVLSSSELEQLHAVIQGNMLLQAQQGYEKGVHDGLEAAKNNTKLCPRNI